ncbi:hypothetical protein GA0070612_3980 [Micromonospora chokoriensis]|uniref:Uncharacterized protein n=1 Tax=Micromonospora chokoriensis TaxID=356851 RepID=A0A1C4XUS6_9ACTN|nr:hypothetical protein GA0070612_3980 [Micromonospora chokoriensis]
MRGSKPSPLISISDKMGITVLMPLYAPLAHQNQRGRDAGSIPCWAAVDEAIGPVIGESFPIGGWMGAGVLAVLLGATLLLIVRQRRTRA